MLKPRSGRKHSFLIQDMPILHPLYCKLCTLEDTRSFLTAFVVTRYSICIRSRKKKKTAIEHTAVSKQHTSTWCGSAQRRVNISLHNNAPRQNSKHAHLDKLWCFVTSIEKHSLCGPVRNGPPVLHCTPSKANCNKLLGLVKVQI